LRSRCGRRAWFPAGGGDVAGDRAFDVVNRAKDAPFAALPSEPGEEAFDGVEPGHFAGRHGSLDGRDEADELLMAMARHTAADDLAIEHTERGEQGRRTVAFVIVREGCALPPFRRKTGWVRSSAWIWLFSSTETTTAYG
jgi:hypothetical protein